MGKIKLEANKWYKVGFFFQINRNYELDEEAFRDLLIDACRQTGLEVLIDSPYLILGGRSERS